MGIVQELQETIEKVMNEMCDNYCKYPEKYTKEEWDEIAFNDDSPCINCPLTRLMQEKNEDFFNYCSSCYFCNLD